MHTDVSLGTWAKINDNCPIEFSINGDHDVELLMGGYSEGFEMIFTPTALERFLAVAAQAVVEVRRHESQDQVRP